jgi:hypothetical protein
MLCAAGRAERTLVCLMHVLDSCAPSPRRADTLRGRMQHAFDASTTSRRCSPSRLQVATLTCTDTMGWYSRSAPQTSEPTCNILWAPNSHTPTPPHPTTPTPPHLHTLHRAAQTARYLYSALLCLAMKTPTIGFSSPIVADRCGAHL